LLRLKYNNSIADAVAHLGKPEDIGRVFIGFQKYLYQQEARSAGTPRLMTASLDVTDPTAARRVVSDAVDHFGRIDVLVNNAGYGLITAFEEMSPEQIHQQFATNVYGVMNVTRA